MHGAFLVVPTPWCLGCGLGDLLPTVGAPGGGLERRLELLLQENSPNCPQVSLYFHFFFLRNSSCSILRSIQGRAHPLTMTTSPARLGDCPGQGPTQPNSHSPQLVHMVSVGLPLRLYWPPCNSSNQVSLGAAQIFFGRGGSH